MGNTLGNSLAEAAGRFPEQFSSRVEEFSQLRSARSMPDLRREHLPRVPSMQEVASAFRGSGSGSPSNMRWHWASFQCAGDEERTVWLARRRRRQQEAAGHMRMHSEHLLRRCYWQRLNHLRMYGPRGDSPRPCAFTTPTGSPVPAPRSVVSPSVYSACPTEALPQLDLDEGGPLLPPGMYTGAGNAVGVTILVGLDVVSPARLHVHVRSFSRFTVWNVPYSLERLRVEDDSTPRTVVMGPELMRGMEGTVVEHIGVTSVLSEPLVRLAITVRVAWFAPPIVVNTDCRLENRDVWDPEEVRRTAPPFGQLMAEKPS
eukprot:TRINITY_DN66979_c0_g1_i1.p1 TRINITY_DN66979_c0_g1~~TRINITY_DN66979_c0_g1_i1.p1  ORF type:complete len:316 (+),score=77.30 TRINITY_DN66979_c0_g1_i1:89-1036(+)